MAKPRPRPTHPVDAKARWPNPAQAWRVARKRRGKGKIADVYRCLFCGGWHQGQDNNPMRP